jgi:hypothetical protein
MPEDRQFLKRSTAKQWADEIIAGLSIPAVTATAGTYQNPARAKINALTASLLVGQGLTRASHLLALLSGVEELRTTQYTTATAGSWEAPELNLRRRAEALLPRPDDLVKPTTARAVLELMKLATFS